MVEMHTNQQGMWIAIAIALVVIGVTILVGANILRKVAENATYANVSLGLMVAKEFYNPERKLKYEPKV